MKCAVDSEEIILVVLVQPRDREEVWICLHGNSLLKPLGGAGVQKHRNSFESQESKQHAGKMGFERDD